MRAPDDSIPGSEQLFRQLRETWVDGDRVLPDAIDSKGSSCHRESYASDPVALVTLEWPKVAGVRVEQLPVEIRQDNPPEGAPAWEFFALDLPEPNRDAHCEIRVRRLSRRPSTDNDDAFGKRPPEVRHSLKMQLADRFRVR